jgi:hypothetical protein
MAVEAIKRDIRDVGRRANRSTPWAGGSTNPQTVRPRRLHGERARPILRRLNRLPADAQKAAERLGIAPSAISLVDE